MNICVNWQNRRQKTFRLFLTLSKSLHFPVLLFFACHGILKAKIIFLLRSQSKPFRARTVPICLSIQVLAQQVPVLVTTCQCYYRIPGNNGKKGWSHSGFSSHLLTTHESFCMRCIHIFERTDLPGPSAPRFGEHYLLTHLCWLW